MYVHELMMILIITQRHLLYEKKQILADALQ